MKKTIIFFLAIIMLSGCTVKKNTVSTDGSTSVERVIGALGESFMINNIGKSFTYNPTGSGSGITAVLDERCDIGLASRALKKEEKALGLKETILAYDGISVVINRKNTVSDLTTQQLALIYTGEITNWSALGGTDSEIVLIGREAGSGTREGFETVTGTKDICKYRQELTSAGDVITTVAQNPNAIGYTSLASVKESVVSISVNGVSATEETIKNGKYVLQRPFILITKTDKPLGGTAQQFFDYITSPQASQIISKAGAVPAN